MVLPTEDPLGGGGRGWRVALLGLLLAGLPDVDEYENVLRALPGGGGGNACRGERGWSHDRSSVTTTDSRKKWRRAAANQHEDTSLRHSFLRYQRY
eukprot:scaffold11172_cov172-Amphora_coffeaeformis.AAC.7